MKRTCLLTGASGYFGKAFMERYAPRYKIIAVHNANVVQFAARDQELVDPLAPSREIAANQHPVYPMQADLGQPSSVDRLVDDVATQFGNIDLLINAAAMRAWSPALAPEATDVLEDVFRINLLAPFRLAVTVARRLWQSSPAANQKRNRNIINISSSAGLYVYPDLGQSLYGASKAGLNHLTYHLASEFWNLGVRVNAVAPNTFPGRVATAEVLEAVIKLDGSEQTGQVVPLLGTGQ